MAAQDSNRGSVAAVSIARGTNRDIDEATATGFSPRAIDEMKNATRNNVFTHERAAALICPPGANRVAMKHAAAGDGKFIH